MVGLEHYLVLSAVLFAIGLYGALTRRNAVVMLMCVEIMLNAVNVALVAISSSIIGAALAGQVFAIFVMVVAAAEAAVALAIIISIYRNRESIDITNVNLMKW